MLVLLWVSVLEIRVVYYPNDRRFSLISRRCCSCEYFKGFRVIRRVDKFCQGIVVWMDCSGEGLCEKLGEVIKERRMCKMHKPSIDVLAAAKGF